jgi:hypothetical protein
MTLEGFQKTGSGSIALRRRCFLRGRRRFFGSRAREYQIVLVFATD